MSELRKKMTAAAVKAAGAQKQVKKKKQTVRRALKELRKCRPNTDEYKRARKAYYAAKKELSDAEEEQEEAVVNEERAVDDMRTIRRFFQSKGAPPKKRTKNKEQKADDGTRVALTWGDAGENHVGMQIIGKKQAVGTGFTVDELAKVGTAFGKAGVRCELIRLDKYTEEPAAVLVIRKLMKGDFLVQLKEELASLEWDVKYYDRRRGRVLNKRARTNLMFQHGVSAEPCYEEGRGRIVDIDRMPLLSEAEKILHSIPAKVLGKRWIPLVCEGNYYYDAKKTGIGFHGDTERTRVVCLSVGAQQYPMRWQCFCRGKVVGEPIEVFLDSGDAYIMSEKAVGNDWKKRTINTLRHAAGAKKYIVIQKDWLPSPDDVQEEPVRLFRK